MGAPDHRTPPHTAPHHSPTSACPAAAVTFQVYPDAACPPHHDQALEVATERAWQRLCAANPRLHDAPIWSVEHVSRTQLRSNRDAQTPPATPGGVDGSIGLSLAIRPARYRQLATQRQPELIGLPGLRRVRLLGVKGFIIARDHAGRPHVLFARRHPDTRVYPGLWEIAPGGGVNPHEPHELDPCSDGSLVPDETDLLRTLREELDEELGLPWDSTIASHHLLGGVDDTQADSFDLIYALHWAGTIDPAAPLPTPAQAPPADRPPQRPVDRWEVTRTAWVPLDHPQTLSVLDLTPPTRAALSLREQALP